MKMIRWARRTPATVLVVCALASACAHWDLDEPAPGRVDVSTPPPLLEQRHIVPPRPAGERVLAINPGILGSIGFWAGPDGAGPWATWAGEVTIHWGERAEHHVDEFSPEPEPTIIGFDKSWALTVGASTRSAARSHGASTGSDLYLEIERMSSLSGIAAGPVWNPATGKVGGQMTAFVGLAYARITTFDFNPVIQIGISVKVPASVIWSR